MQLIAEFGMYYHMSPVQVLDMPYTLFMSMAAYKGQNTAVLERIYLLIAQAIGAKVG